MTSCLLCLESMNESESIEIIQNICTNFTIENAIKEYFRCSKTILESQLRFICTSCFKNLENFHNFATKVNNLYNNHQKYETFISNDNQNVSQQVDNNEDSFIDDIIEYDVNESIEFEDNERLSEDLYSFNVLDHNEPSNDLDSQILTENMNDPENTKSKFVNVLTKSSALSIQTLHSSPVRLILPKNCIKISQTNFQTFNLKKLQNETKVHTNLEFFEPKNIFSNLSSLFCNKKSKIPIETQEIGDFDTSGTQKSIKPALNPKTPSSNLKSSSKQSKNHQNIQISSEHKPNQQKIHKCEICIKNFKTSAILKSHFQKIHSDTQSTSICRECGKIYTNKYTLKTHMRKHIVDSDKSYECYICKKPSKNLPHLLNHFKYKHDPAYSTSTVCHICSKTVTRLDIHLRQMHSTDPIERVKCEICGHFMKKSSLKGHLASHNETGFSCEECGKFLKNKNSFLCHMKRVHTAGKYKCEHCDKAFHQESRLMDHIACQHTGIFLHKCRIADCEKKFRNAGRRRLHERRMHPDDYEKNFKASYLRENLECQ